MALGVIRGARWSRGWRAGLPIFWIGSRFKSRLGSKFRLRFLLYLCPVANSAMISTLTAHCQWKEETVREGTDHPTSYALAKKMKSLTLYTHGCPWASLRN